MALVFPNSDEQLRRTLLDWGLLDSRRPNRSQSTPEEFFYRGDPGDENSEETITAEEFERMWGE